MCVLCVSNHRIKPTLLSASCKSVGWLLFRSIKLRFVLELQSCLRVPTITLSIVGLFVWLTWLSTVWKTTCIHDTQVVVSVARTSWGTFVGVRVVITHVTPEEETRTKAATCRSSRRHKGSLCPCIFKRAARHLCDVVVWV